MNLEKLTAISVNNESTITSIEIANLTRKEHKHVMRDIRNLLSQGVAESNFGPGSYSDANGNERALFNLTKKGSLILASGYNALLREAIIYRWEELENLNSTQNANIPQTYAQALALAAEQALQIELQQSEIEQQSTRINKLVHSDKVYTASELAKECGFRSAIEFNEAMKKKGVQYKVNGTWIPRANYAEKAYMSMKQNDDGEVIYDGRWTIKGREFALSLFDENYNKAPKLRWHEVLVDEVE